MEIIYALGPWIIVLWAWYLYRPPKNKKMSAPLITASDIENKLRPGLKSVFGNYNA